jgi:hypothetical protein
VASAEGETSFFAAAFAPDNTLSVPTAALRARLNAAVAQLEASAESEQRHPQARGLGGFWASLSGLFAFTPRAAAAFATLLVAVAAGIIYISSQRSQQAPTRASEGQQVANVGQPGASEPTAGMSAVIPAPAASPDPEAKGRGSQVVNHKPRASSRGGVKRQPSKSPAVKEEVLPGEQEYRTAIASLEKTIKLGGDESLRPALRADYERNIALLDSAIEQTRRVAAQNPKDKDAVGFLMATYQSKVELLTRVADEAQVAALGR